MNKTRRGNIRSLIKRLNTLLERAKLLVDDDWIDDLQDLIDNLTDVLCEEEEYRDNIPENLQGSSRYEKADCACDSLDCAISGLEYIDAEDNLDYIERTINEAINELEQAME